MGEEEMRRGRMERDERMGKDNMSIMVLVAAAVQY
jgi:hypothetical protein